MALFDSGLLHIRGLDQHLEITNSRQPEYLSDEEIDLLVIHF